MSVPVKSILQTAIRKERSARAFYLKAARSTRDAASKKLLSDLADEEARHADILSGEGVKNFLASEPPAITDLRIEEFLTPKRVSPKASFQDVLIYAIKREAASYRAYQTLAEAAGDASTCRVFRRLANEERRHRNRLEKLYDDVIFREN